MKLIAISGSWRNISNQLVIDLAKQIDSVLTAGNGTVMGGVLGVDYLIIELAMR